MAGGGGTKPLKHPLVYIVFNKIQRKSKVVYLIKRILISTHYSTIYKIKCLLQSDFSLTSESEKKVKAIFFWGGAVNKDTRLKTEKRA